MTPACLACGGTYFRTVTHPVSEKVLPLYPMPGTRFLVLALDSGGQATGFALCPVCAEKPLVDLPDLAASVPGFASVEALDAPRTRSGWWYSPGYGRHLEAWLRDHLRLDPEPFVRQWRADCEAEGVTVA